MSRYDIEKFDPPPDPDLVCCICQCVLDKAVECPCRHVFCQSCIERWLSNRHTCPTCRKRTRKQDLKPVLPLVQNMLNRLMMICEHKDNGCIEKIMLEHFERHIKNCGYEMKTCRFSKCGIRILRMHLDKHENEECEHREMVCEGECGLMIPLSERPSHNCVAALKAHIDEKNRMIEQLKVKLHELNNLSQSLNDQLVELRQQLNDRTHIFSSASSDSSESDVTDFMSDDLSRDSFRDSWFDSAASNISGDIVDNAGNAANNDVNQGNNNTAGHSEGSDVVEQVERTVVNSLFELSSRLERVRNQMRAVLNSRLVQDQNNLNDEVRIPSAAELDAIVNHGNNDNNNTAPVHSVTNPSNSSNMNDNQDDYRFESQQNRDSSNSATEAYYVSDDDNHLDSHRYSSYANDNQERNFNEENQPANTVGSDVSDLNWISDTDTNYTAEVHSPNIASSPVYERYTPFRNENHNYNNQYISEHVILSQPPDSPSDTTGSFSSIPSTSSVAFSPLRSPGHEDSNHDSLSATQASNDNCSPAPSDRGFTSSDNNSKSPRSSVSRSPDSHSNDNNSGHGSASFTISSPAHSVSSIASTVRDQSSKSEASHVSSDEEYSSSANRDSQNESKSSVSESSSSESQESDCEDVRNVSILHDNKEENHDDARNVDRSLDYDHDASHEVNENTDHHIETSADDISHQEEEHNDTDDVEDNHHQNDTDFEQGHVSRCEPDSTQSPLAIQQHQNSCTSSSSSENQILISTATESTDSEDSDSLKYLTKRIRRSERTADVNCTANINNYHIANESSDPSSTVDSGFITGSNSPSTLSQPLSRKSSGRKRKYNCNNEYGENKDRVRGDSSRNDSDQKWYSHSPETVSNNLSYNRYGFKKRVYDNDHNTVDSCKKVKASGVSTHHLNNQTNSHRSRTSPPRNRQQWREPTHHLRRNRTSLNRWDSQSNDNNGQSLNVKIDLSLINYSGHIGTESAGATIPTATVVHSANISPIPTASSVKRDTVLTNSRQNLSDDNVKSSTPKQEDATKRSSHRQRSSRAQRHDTHNSMRNSNNNSSPVRGTLNVNNTSSRDFPNSWRDSSESSSDNTWEPASDCDEMDDSSTEADDGFETESSYEVQIPKSTAALLEEYASDESDESWTVGMN